MNEAEKLELENQRKSLEKFLDFCKNEYDRVMGNIKTVEERIRNNTIFSGAIITAATLIRKPDSTLPAWKVLLVYSILSCLFVVMFYFVRVLMIMRKKPFKGVEIGWFKETQPDVDKFQYEVFLITLQKTYIRIMEPAKENYELRRVIQNGQAPWVAAVLFLAAIYALVP